MIDDIIGEVGKGFFRIIGQIFAEIVFHTVFYFIGWPFLKLVTLGKYPKGMQQAGSTVTSCVGMVVTTVIAVLLLG